MTTTSITLHDRTRVKEQVAGRTGASWEDRLQQQKAVKVQAMKMIEKVFRAGHGARAEMLGNIASLYIYMIMYMYI